jgi:hypothetical protein
LVGGCFDIEGGEEEVDMLMLDGHIFPCRDLTMMSKVIRNDI